MTKEKTLRRFLIEDAAAGVVPSNNAGEGHVAGVRPGDDPVIFPADQKRWIDETGKTCAGAKVFETDGETISKHKDGKHPRHRYDRYFSDAEKESGRAETVRQYGRANAKKNIMLKDSRTGAMVFVRRSKPAGLREDVAKLGSLLNESITPDELGRVVEQAGALGRVIHTINEFYTGSKFPHVGELYKNVHLATLKQLQTELKELIKLYKEASK